MKSLFIIGLPRSGTSRLQDICVQALGFEEIFEPLSPNNQMRDERFLRGIPFSAKEEWYEKFKENLIQFQENCVVKEVAQTKFFCACSEWLIKTFHVIYLRRTKKEVLAHWKRRGWGGGDLKGVISARQADLKRVNWPVILDFWEFVKDEKILNGILKEWYGKDAGKYINGEFKKKRHETEQLLKECGLL